MQTKISENNYYIYFSSPSLEDCEISEQNKLNALQKALRQKNRKLFADRILQIGTLLAYTKQTKNINKLRLQFN